MFLRSLRPVPIVILLACFSFGQSRELRVCADPDNMPFSTRARQGFENRIAEVVAKGLSAHLSYVWQRMGRGFIREFLDKAQCDLLIGLPANFPAALTTSPYYRSTYVFVSRRDGGPQVTSFDDPGLRGIKIGVQALEEEYTPPGEALSRRGLQTEIVGYDSAGADAGSIIRAVVSKEVGIAVVWGPLAGYFSQKYGSQLTLTPVEPEVDPPGLPLTFAISMGVRKGNAALRDEVDKVLASRQAEIQQILTNYGVPQLALPPRNVQSAAN